MGVTFTIVDAVVDRGIDDDGFFNFDVNLKPSAVQSFIRMAWPGSSDTASSKFDYKFDKGVTIDPVTGLLVVPPGVSQFSLKRLIREEDSDDFLANAQLELNGRSVIEGDYDLIKVAAAKPAIVTGLQAVRVSAFEGQRFVVKVYVSGPGVVKLSLKGSSGANPKSDFMPQSAWTFTNGLRWAPDKTSIIVPPGRKSFNITITTKQDAIPENIESFLLTIGNKTQPLIVQPTAEVTSLVGRSRLEGGNLIFSFRLKASNFKTYLPIGARFSNGDKADVAKITNWRPTAGVKLTQSGFFIIPPRVTAFDFYVPTIDDAIFEKTTSLTLGAAGKSATAYIFDDADVKSVTPTFGASVRGGFAEFVIQLNQASKFGRYIQLSLGQTNKPGFADYNDVEKMRDWSANNGVALRSNGLFLVPANITQFKVNIGILATQQSPSSEKLQLVANGKSATVAIQAAAKIQWIRLINRPSAIEGSGEISYRVKLQLPAPFTLALSIVQNSAYKFNLSLSDRMFSSQIGLRQLRNSREPNGNVTAIISGTPNVDEFTIIIKAASDRFWSGNQDIQLKIGTRSQTFKIFDDRKQIKPFFDDLRILSKSGASHLLRQKLVQAAAIETGAGGILSNERMENFADLVDGIQFARNAIVSTVIKAQERKATIEYSKYYARAIGAIASAISDFNAPTSFPRGGTPEQVLANAQTSFKTWSQIIRNGVGNLQTFMQVMILYIASSNPKSDDWNWMDEYRPGGLNERMDKLMERVGDFSTFLQTELNDLKAEYAHAEEKLNTQFILDIFCAVVSGISVLGSAGFFIANYRAYRTQMAPFRALPPDQRTGAQSWLSFALMNAINLPAVFGSSTLILNNFYGIVYSSIVSASYVKPFQYDKDIVGKAMNEFSTVNERFKEIDKTMNEFLEFFLREGGAGDRDYVAETIYLNQPNQKERPSTGLNFLNYKEKDPKTGQDVPFTKISWWVAPRMSNLGEYIQEKWEIRFETPTVPVVSNSEGAQSAVSSQTLTPIVLDLTGDGLAFSSLSSAPLFDANHDGQRDRMAWVKGGTALLAFDVDHDGAITRTDEISFVGYKEGAKTDLEGLTAFDSNEDHVFDAHDQLWHQFGVWRDTNGDGISQAGEFVSLAQAGITSISLISDQQVSVQGDVLIYGRSHFTRTDGSLGTVGDVGFRYMNG